MSDSEAELFNCESSMKHLSSLSVRKIVIAPIYILSDRWTLADFYK